MSLIRVSKMVGVSTATVSRVIHDSPLVAPQTVEAVRRAMDEIGYHPKPRVLRKRGEGAAMGRRPLSVVALFADSHDLALRTPLSGRLLHGIEESLRKAHARMLVTRLESDGRLPRGIDARHVDGVLVRPGLHSWSDEVLADLRELPVVWMLEQQTTPAFGDMVIEDNAMIGHIAAEYLADRGHRHCAYMSLTPRHPSFKHRQAQFIETCKAEGVSVDVFLGREEIVVADSELAAAAAEQVANLVRRSPLPTGLFVPGPDHQILVIYRALSAAGLQIRKDIDLISCNNDAMALSAMDPSLPNIDINAEAIGRAAAETVVWRRANPGEPQRRVVINASLVDPSKS